MRTPMNTETWAKKLHTRLKQSLQTRTSVTDENALLQSRQQGTVQAYRRITAILLTTQLILWVTAGYDRAAQAIWQAAAGLLLPALGLWLSARTIWKANRRSSRRETLLLIPCLLLDAAIVLLSLMSLLQQLMPSYPRGVLQAIIPTLLIAGALLGGKNGAAYGLGLWRWLLAGILATILLSVHRGEGFARLFPLPGNGVAATLRTGLAGLGSLWMIPLLFLLPPTQRSIPAKKPAGSFSYVLVPMLCLMAFSLALAVSAPWRAEERLTIGQKLLALSRTSRSMPIVGLGALLWLLSLMIAYTASLHFGARLITDAAPRIPAALAVLLLALPSLILMFFEPMTGHPAFAQWMMILSGGRFLLAVGCVVWGWISSQRGG